MKRRDSLYGRLLNQCHLAVTQFGNLVDIRWIAFEDSTKPFGEPVLAPIFSFLADQFQAPIVPAVDPVDKPIRDIDTGMDVSPRRISSKIVKNVIIEVAQFCE